MIENDPLAIGPDGLTVDGLTSLEAQEMMLEVLLASRPGKEHSNEEIARIIGCTHQRVRQIYLRAMEKMRSVGKGGSRKRRKRPAGSGKVLPDSALEIIEWKEAA